MPDEEVDLTLEDYNADRDPQMERAVEILLSDEQIATSTDESLENSN